MPRLILENTTLKDFSEVPVSVNSATFSLSTAVVRRQPSWLIIAIVGVILMAVTVYRTAGWYGAAARMGPLEVQVLLRVALTVVGLIIWTSLAKAYSNAFGRNSGLSWWRLAEVYLVTSLIMAPHALHDGWSFFNNASLLPYSLLLEKALQLIWFWVAVVRLTAQAQRDGRRP